MDGLSAFEVRNLRFSLGSEVPRFWHGGRRSVTTFFDAMSIFFPHGERFFVQAVNAHRSFVHEPRLIEEVRAFGGQEGVHSREHVRYNAMLRERGYDVDAMEARVGALLDRVRGRAPVRSQLAITCALEHFTSLLGHLVLDDPRGLEGAHPTMAALWRWHAAEECEHKNVAFEVFLAAGGTYPERVGLMLSTTVIFWAKVLEHQARMMAHDGIAFSLTEWMALGRFLFVEPGGMRRILPGYLAYFRPSFHPSSIDSHSLVDAWRRAFPQTEAYGGAA